MELGFTECISNGVNQQFVRHFQTEEGEAGWQLCELNNEAGYTVVCTEPRAENPILEMALDAHHVEGLFRTTTEWKRVALDGDFSLSLPAVPGELSGSRGLTWNPNDSSFFGLTPTDEGGLAPFILVRDCLPE